MIGPSACATPSILVLQVLYKHVTNLDSMSPSDGIMVLDTGPQQSRARVGSGRPLLSTCCPDAHWALIPPSPPQQVLLENWGFSHL